MIIGKVADCMKALKKGKAVSLSIDDLSDSAKVYMNSGFDHVRPEYIKAVLDEINSSEYPDLEIWQHCDGGFILQRN